MHVYILLAGIASLLTTMGHFTLGYKMYVKPMLDADFEPVAKRVMLSIYHYMSVFLILATLSLLYLGLVLKQGNRYNMLFILFLGTNFALMAIAQLLVALFSKIPNGIWKIFQWLFFAVVAMFIFLGI